MKEKIKQTLSYAITIALIFLLIYCMVGLWGQKKTGTLFFPFGYRPVVILSGSMEETLHTGAVVLVKKTKKVEDNDIIFFFSSDGVPVIHRCVKVLENQNYITKGDANANADFETISTDQVQGKVIYIMNWTAPILNFGT